VKSAKDNCIELARSEGAMRPL